MALVLEPERKGASALYRPFFVCICRDVAKGSEPSYGQEIVRSLEADFAIIRAHMAEVGRLLLEAPVVKEYDWLA